MENKKAGFEVFIGYAIALFFQGLLLTFIINDVNGFRLGFIALFFEFWMLLILYSIAGRIFIWFAQVLTKSFDNIADGAIFADGKPVHFGEWESALKLLLSAVPPIALAAVVFLLIANILALLYKSTV